MREILREVSLFVADEKQIVSKTEEKLAGVAATFLGKQMEN